MIHAGAPEFGAPGNRAQSVAGAAYPIAVTVFNLSLEILMKKGGYVAIYRSVWDHPVFQPEKFSEREAWMWMIANAAWTTMEDLRRGQIKHSERFLARRWGWTKSKVHRFLNRLREAGMTEPASEADMNHLTICNYEDFQGGGTITEPPSEPKYKNREEEEKKGRKDAALQAAIEVPETEDAALYRRGKEILGSSSYGSLITRLLRAKNGSVPLARSALELAATKHDPKTYVFGVIRGAEELATKAHPLGERGDDWA